jgi:hypothetical protein
MAYEAEVSRLEQVWRSHVAGDPRAQLARWREREPDVEARLSVPTPSSQQVLLVVCRRFGLRLYRLPRQRSSTMCVQVPPGFLREVLHPVLQGMAEVVEEAAHRQTIDILERWSPERERSAATI